MALSLSYLGDFHNNLGKITLCKALFNHTLGFLEKFIDIPKQTKHSDGVASQPLGVFLHFIEFSMKLAVKPEKVKIIICILINSPIIEITMKALRQ